MSRVLTTNQLVGVVRGNIGYQLAVLQKLKQYRLIQAAGAGDIIQAFWDSLAQGDSAYSIEEFEIWRDWMTGVYGLPGAVNRRADIAWAQGWRLHLIDPAFVSESPSPIVQMMKLVESGGVPTLPQEPQRRVVLRCDGVKRTVRVKD